jgi:predicted MFS family arabinose efflux permease
LNGRTASARLRFQLVAFSAARLVLNTGHRMIYPFLPAIARGLGVDLSAVALIVTARSGLGLISPLFGSLADRQGRKVAMLVGVLIFAGAMGLVTLWPTYPALFAGLILASAGKMLFDPSMQAYLGDRVHYERRGLAIAITELGWSGAFLLGIPLAGWLIARTDSWNAPFAWLGGLGLLSAVLIWRVIPPDVVRSGERPSLAQGLRIVLAHRSALAGLSIALLISTSSEIMTIIYGAWMEDAFELKVAELGAASAVIGFAELGGEGLVAGLVDQLGKRRAVAAGIGLNALASILLPLLGFSLEGALVGLFFLFISFEFAVVSAIPLMTELLPHARATLMAGNVAAFSAGRMIGALCGPALFSLGLLANGAVAATLDVIALAVLIGFVRHK